MEFRGYCPGDFEGMYRLDVSCFAEPFRFSRTAMRRFAEARKARVVVAESAGEMVGFCVAHVERGTGYVVTLDVAEGWRRQGLAAEMMRRVEAKMVESGCGWMGLHVWVENEAAVTFYESAGYERMGRVKAFYGVGLDAWAYRKRLMGNGL